MANKKQSTTNTSGKLLFIEEQDVCQKIAEVDAGVASIRAEALIAIDEGVSKSQVSERLGLTPGQIRYLLTTFRKKRLAIFPDDVLKEVQSPVEWVEAVDIETEFNGKKNDTKKDKKKSNKKRKVKKEKVKKEKAKKDKAKKKDKKTKKEKTKAKKIKKAKKSKKEKNKSKSKK